MNPEISPRFASLWQARKFSRLALERLARALEPVLDAANLDVVTVVAGGSLGRLEAAGVSDVDLIVVVDVREDGPVPQRIEGLDEAFAVAGLKPPKPDGIYARPVAHASLLDPAARGSLDEPAATFGSRMQVLLDGRAVLYPDRFQELRDRVVAWYAGDTGSHAWTHLFNDLSRYLHAYAVWQQFKFARSPDDGWLLRQAKFRSTRIVTFAGLLFLLAECCARADGSPAWLGARLGLSPLERLLFVFGDYDDVDADGFAAGYDAVHALLADPVVRTRLIEASPAGPAGAIECPVWDEIYSLTSVLLDALTRFVLARASDWPLNVFRNWLL